MRLFDAHCHLQDERLLPDMAGVLDRARRAGVERLACCGSCEEDWPRVTALAARDPAVRPQYGLHPWYIRARTPDWAGGLRALLEADPTAGVGEIGLDHAEKALDPADQMSVFMTQLELARELGRPVSVHCRRAWSDLLQALERIGKLPAGVVVHSYSGSRETIAPLARLGGCFSFSGSITHPHNRRGRDAVPAVPLDRLLIETDAPDIPPFGTDPSTPNEPANLPIVLRAVAELRAMPPEETAERLWENSVRLYR